MSLSGIRRKTNQSSSTYRWTENNCDCDSKGVEQYGLRCFLETSFLNRMISYVENPSLNYFKALTTNSALKYVPPIHTTCIQIIIFGLLNHDWRNLFQYRFIFDSYKAIHGQFSLPTITFFLGRRLLVVAGNYTCPVGQDYRICHKKRWVISCFSDLQQMFRIIN